jgi:mono/diheme cytochrome c family protein
MTRFVLRSIGLFLVLSSLAVLACSFVAEAPVQPSGSREEQRYYAELEKVPEKDRNRSNPLEGDTHAVGAGQKLFGQHCAECHGSTATGGRRAPSLRAQQVQGATPGMLFFILTNGVVRRGMPVWSRLPEQQRWQIVSYLKSLN